MKNSKGYRRMAIRYLSREELQGKVDAILAQYPWMADYPAGCCSGCTQSQVADEHGWDVADVWQDYQSWLFLLDDKTT